LKENLGKSNIEITQRKLILEQLHIVIKEKEEREKDLLMQIAALEKKISDYLGEEQSFDVYKIGLINSMAKVQC
jgi:hypothetical protein